MSTHQNAGIDYGMGSTNIDHETGIRHGVIPAHAVGETWYERSVARYEEPTCSECGNEVVEYDDDKHSDYDLSTIDDFVCEQ